MKPLARLTAVIIFFATLLSVVHFTSVQAQAQLTTEQKQRISANCLSIKNSLNQLHASDALLRVNRGQLYEAIGTRLMNNFNTRLTSNSLDARGLLVVTTSYKNALDTFRADYQSYERQLSALIKIDCQAEPAEFHENLEDARLKRTKVHEGIVRLNQYIDDYRAAANDFLVNFERVNEE